MRKSNNTLRNFIINHKAVSVASVIVLIVAVGTGIIFGINNKNTIKTEEKSSFSEQVSKNSASKSKKTDASEVEDTSVDSQTSETTSSVVEGSTSASTTAAVSSKSSSNIYSKPSNNTSSKASGTTSQNTGSITGGGTTSTSTGWVCPNPAAHGDTGQGWCHSAAEHQSLINEWNEIQAALAKQQQKTYPAGYNQFTWCDRCNRPRGDGYNGTCFGYFCNGKYSCHHYDTGDTCQIHHE